MIITSCPLRISLVGGSTDTPAFLQKYKRGAVISLACNLRTFVILHKDVLGSNVVNSKFILDYRNKESVSTTDEIKNELIKNCFEFLEVNDPINCMLTADIFSVGSGLAASSSYVMALVKSIFELRNISISDNEVRIISRNIERRFNPLVGDQDFYGSVGGLKHINFYENGAPTIEFLNTNIFKKMNMYLMYSTISRRSTTVLNTIDVDKSVTLLQDVEDLYDSIACENVTQFNKIMSRSWENKKETSPYLCSNETLMMLDKMLCDDKDVLSHKLCGAGGGGYFLIFSDSRVDLTKKLGYKNIKQIFISNAGLTTARL